ncbi:uncharacterized protein [Porites lutea]|uniref:uncharacterized protein isoform X2 n=1 Tax=Porites lutea TaxID=51062 RepID=UPI003CC57C2E
MYKTYARISSGESQLLLCSRRTNMASNTQAGSVIFTVCALTFFSTVSSQTLSTTFNQVFDSQTSTATSVQPTTASQKAIDQTSMVTTVLPTKSSLKSFDQKFVKASTVSSVQPITDSQKPSDSDQSK